MTPPLTVVVCGPPGTATTELTLRSVRSSGYDGPVQVLVEDGVLPSVPRITEEATGELLAIVPAGAVLDSRCLMRLAHRAVQTPQASVVVPEVRGADGLPLPPGLHVEPPRRGARAARHSGVAHRTHHPIDVTSSCIMLVRTGQFLAAGGFPEDLATSPFLAAALVARLSESDSEVIVDDAAVAYAPGGADAPERRPGYELFGGGGLEPDGAAPAPTTAVLWVTPHLPDRDRSGGDARHLEMIEALTRGGADVTVWSQHGGDTGRSGRQLATAGAHWEAPLPARRWSTGSSAAPFHLLDELIAERRWSAVIVADPGLVAPVALRTHALAPDAPIVADLRSVQFPAAHREEPVTDGDDTAARVVIDAIEGADGVSTASQADAEVVRSAGDGPPTFVFHAVGAAGGGGPASDGPPLFVGDLLHHPNVQALEWWVEELAGLVFARAGRPIKLRAVGRGAEAYRRTWDRPDKIEIGGWQPHLADEYRRARLLVVPLPYTTGTGGRIGSALRAGLPVVASAAAAAVLPADTARLVSTGRDAAELADHVARLATDDEAWGDACARIAAADLSSDRQAEAWNAWWPALQPARSAEEEALSPTPGSRRGPRRPARSS